MRSFRDRGGEAMRALMRPDLADSASWKGLSAGKREWWCIDFDRLVEVTATFGLRIEDDQTPHGPDVGGGDARTEHA